MAKKLKKVEKEKLAKVVELLKEEKGFTEDDCALFVENMLKQATKKFYGDERNVNVRVVINRDNWTYHVYRVKTIVEEVADFENEITLAEARMINPKFKLGEEVVEEVDIDSFDRISVHNGTQVGEQAMIERDKSLRYDEYKKKEGQMVPGTILQIDGRNNRAIVNLGRVQGFLPYQEQTHLETYKQGDTMHFLITEVNNNKDLYIWLSRKKPGLIKELLTRQVPEIQDGTVVIKSISREAGKRAKVAVESKNENVDPQGACIGVHGSRINAVIDELHGEKIDIVVWDAVPGKFIANALSPAKVTRVEVDEASKSATVIVPDEEHTNAIGAGGQNARLAVYLTGYRIDIKSESQVETEAEEDFDFDFEMGDEIEAI